MFKNRWSTQAINSGRTVANLIGILDSFSPPNWGLVCFLFLYFKFLEANGATTVWYGGSTINISIENWLDVETFQVYNSISSQTNPSTGNRGHGTVGEFQKNRFLLVRQKDLETLSKIGFDTYILWRASVYISHMSDKWLMRYTTLSNTRFDILNK